MFVSAQRYTYSHNKTITLAHKMSKDFMGHRKTSRVMLANVTCYVGHFNVLRLAFNSVVFGTTS